MRQKTYLYPWDLFDSDGIMDSLTDYGSLLDITLKIVENKNDG